MTTDLDQLRALLEQRAELAPDPNSMLPTTHRLIERRRARRRASAIGGLATATVLALITVSVVEQRNAPADQDTVAPATAQLTGPALVGPTVPFTVSRTFAGQSLRNVGTGPDPSGAPAGNVQYFTPGTGPGLLLIGWRSTEFTSDDIVDQTPTTAGGLPATVGIIAGSPALRVLTWQPRPGLWLWIQGDAAQNSTEALQHLADQLDLRPSIPPTILHLPNLPAGYRLTTWGASYGSVDSRDWEQDQIELCPSSQAFSAGRQCIDLAIATGGVPLARIDTMPAGGPLDGGIIDAPPLASDEPVIRDGGRTVARQVDHQHWAEATTYTGDPTIVLSLIMSVSAD
jgi:hypothetical protein